MSSIRSRVHSLHNDRAVAFPGWIDVPGLLHGTTTRAALPATGKMDLFDAIANLRKQEILPPRLTLGGNQVHGETIASVTGPIQFGGHPAGFRWNAEQQIGEFAETDALVSTIPGVILVVQTADCLPVLLMDRPTKMVGLAHCGWKGAFAGLAGKTACTMIELGAKPSRMEAWIGPSIGACHYEVGVDLVGQFRKKFPNAAISPDNLSLDLAAVVQWQLEEAGLMAEHVFNSGECTRESDRYHSYRATGADAGRMISFISFGPD